MVLKRFAAAPGSTILAAPQGTGRRSGSLLFLSFLQKTSSWSHWLPQRQEKTGKTHSRSSSHLQTASASLLKPSWTRAVTRGWAARCPPDHKTQTHPMSAGPSQEQSGQSSWAWQSLTTHHDHSASGHTRGSYLREIIRAHTAAHRPELCSEHHHLFLKALVMHLRHCNPAQPNSDKWWTTSRQSIRERYCNRSKAQGSTTMHITSQNRESGQKNPLFHV